MPKGGNKDKGQGVGQSVFLVKVNEAEKTVSFSRMPFDQENDKGEVLVRTSEDVIKIVTEATLAEYPDAVRGALTRLVKQHVRSQVRSGPAFEVKKIPLELPAGEKNGKVNPEPEEETDQDSPLPDDQLNPQTPTF